MRRAAVAGALAFTAGQLLADGVWNTLSFGPSLLNKGEIADGIEDVEVDTFGNHSIQGEQPRTARCSTASGRSGATSSVTAATGERASRSRPASGSSPTICRAGTWSPPTATASTPSWTSFAWRPPFRVTRVQDGSPAMVLGTRGFTGSVPARSRFGNNATRLLFTLATGERISDTQTDLRGYPASMLRWLRFVHGERYGYELNLLLESRRAGYAIESVDIATVYLDHNSGSHFRP